MSLINVKDIRKVYRVDEEKIVALGRINLRIEQGEICCILGTSGSGKSTLLNIMAGLEKPTKGSVFIAGKNVTQFTEKQWALFRQRNIGFVFQTYNLLPILNVKENITLPLKLDGRKPDTAFLEEITDTLRLREKLLDMPGMLSGGQQQRVAIARALSTKPAVLLCDEPTGNLDSRTGIEVVGLLKASAEAFHQTILLVTHNEEIAQMADRIIRIEDGKVR